MANIIRTGWEDQYCLIYQTTSISTAGTFTATDDGIGAITTSAKCGLMLNDHPNLNSGKVQDFADKTTGLAQKRYDTGNVYEYTDGRRTPTVSLNMGLNAYRLKILGWLLFQQGTTESTNQAAMEVPSLGEPAMEVWASIGRSLGNITGDDFGQVIHGAVATQLQITGSAGERMLLTAEMSGRTLVTDFDHTSSIFTIETVGEDMFFDYSYTFVAADISNYVESVDITIANNAVPRHYGAQTPSHYVMGKFDTSGTVKIAMSATTGTGDNTQYDNFIAGTDVLLTLEKGTTTQENFVQIKVNMLYNGDPSYDPAEEMLIDLPFEGVYDGTNQSIAIEANNGRSDSIPA